MFVNTLRTPRPALLVMDLVGVEGGEGPKPESAKGLR